MGSGPGEESIRRRAWLPRRQWRAVGIAAAAMAGILVAGVLAEHFLVSRPPGTDTPPSPPGTFRPTAQQLKTFTVQAIRSRAFVSEELTEGKIAVDGDRAMQVFSLLTRAVYGG